LHPRWTGHGRGRDTARGREARTSAHQRPWYGCDPTRRRGLRACRAGRHGARASHSHARGVMTQSTSGGAVPLSKRFAALWRSLEPIGRDPATGGYQRFTWTEAERACREWFVEEAHARSLAVEADRCGHLWAWRGYPH